MKKSRVARSVRKPVVPRRERLLGLLADGRFHSGEALASRLKVSRSAVWKMVRALRAVDIEVQAVPRQGYRLPRAVDLYSRQAILKQVLNPEAIERLDVLLQVDSTNRYLFDMPGPAVQRACVCVAEVQQAGRGRRGRTWIAPFGSGICLSLAWRFPESPPTLSALSLAIGVAIMRALQQFGGTGIGLKWPNDIVWQGRKLAGVLTEVRGESSGPTQIVIGLGLNLRMPAAVRIALAEQQAALVADLSEILKDRLPDRNSLTGVLIGQLTAALQEFGVHGFDAFAREWRTFDSLANAPVKVVAGSESVLGIARGVAPDGALQVEVRGALQRFVSADVSLRALKA